MPRGAGGGGGVSAAGNRALGGYKAELFADRLALLLVCSVCWTNCKLIGVLPHGISTGQEVDRCLSKASACLLSGSHGLKSQLHDL